MLELGLLTGHLRTGSITLSSSKAVINIAISFPSSSMTFSSLPGSGFQQSPDSGGPESRFSRNF